MTHQKSSSLMPLSFKSTCTHHKNQFDSSDNYKKIIHYLKDSDAKFHTNQLQSNKSPRVIIRNLHPSTPETGIASAIEEIDHIKKY
jgi:hypothetical protein